VHVFSNGGSFLWAQALRLAAARLAVGRVQPFFLRAVLLFV
jgi:hypothetical protein